MAIIDKKTFSEDAGIRCLKDFLQQKDEIYADIKQRDKEEIYDGHIILTATNKDKKQEIVKRFVIQIKSTREPQYLKDGRLLHQIPSDFLKSVLCNVDENPTFYIVVDAKNKRIFYLEIAKPFIASLGWDLSKEKNTFHFDTTHEMNNYDKFLSLLWKIKKERDSEINLSSEEIKEYNLALRDFNRKLDIIPSIRDYFFPDLYTFGVAIGSENLRLSNKNGIRLFEGVAAIKAIVPMKLDENSKSIVNYSEEINSYFKHYSFVDMTPQSYFDNCLEQILKDYFEINYGYLTYMPDIIISEIIFAILDEISRKTGNHQKSVDDFRFEKDELSYEELAKLLLKFSPILIGPETSLVGGYDLLNSNLFLAALNEVKNRNLIVKRVWNTNYTKIMTGKVLESEISANYDTFFEQLPSLIIETIKNSGIYFSYEFKGKNYYGYFLTNTDYGFSFHELDIASRPDDGSEFNYEKSACKTRNEFYEKYSGVYNRSSCLDFDNFFLTKTPFFHQVRASLFKLIYDEWGLNGMSSLSAGNIPFTCFVTPRRKESHR